MSIQNPATNQDATPPSPPQDTSLPLPQAHTLLASFASFLTVCIHNILYYRSIYPQTTFLSAKAYNLPVHQNRHPKVCSWIRDAVDAVVAQLAGGNVDRVAVVIHSPLRRSSSEGFQPGAVTAAASAATLLAPGSVLERWMFDVTRFPAWPGGADAMRDFAGAAGSRRQAVEEEEDGEEVQERPDDDEDAVRTGGATGAPAPVTAAAANVNWTDVDQQLRGAVRRLAYAAEKLEPLPEGCTFTIAVELKEEGQAPIGHPQAWIPSEPNLQPASTSRPESGRDLGGARTTAIRSVEAGPLFFECWVEEGKAKDTLRDAQDQQATQSSAS